MSITNLKQVIFNTIFHVDAQLVQTLARTDHKMRKELKRFYKRVLVIAH